MDSSDLIFYVRYRMTEEILRSAVEQCKKGEPEYDDNVEEIGKALERKWFHIYADDLLEFDLESWTGKKDLYSILEQVCYEKRKNIIKDIEERLESE